MLKFLLSSLVALLLSSCGGGGASNSIATFESPTYSATYSTAQLPNLYYEASPSGLTGTFTTNGRFNFKAGDVVTFYISESNKFLVAKSLTLPASFTDLNTNNAEIEKPLLSAYYIDAPVKGLSYLSHPSGLIGETDESGRFKFFNDDIAKLYLDREMELLISEIKPHREERYFLGQKISDQVDLDTLSYVLNFLDHAKIGSKYSDLSNISYGDSDKVNFKKIIQRSYLSRSTQNDIGLWVHGVRSGNSDIFFKNQDLSNLDVGRYAAYESLQGFESLVVGATNSTGSYLLAESGGFEYVSFTAGMVFNQLNLEEGSLFVRSYLLDDNDRKLVLNGYASRNSHCKRVLRLKQKMDNGELYSLLDDISSPLCDDSHAAAGFVFGYSLRNNNYLNDLRGKSIKFRSLSICGDKSVKISYLGDLVNPRVLLDTVGCNIEFSGLFDLKMHPDVNGVYWVDIDTVSPKIRLGLAFVESPLNLVAVDLNFEGAIQGRYKSQIGAISTFVVE